MLSVKFSVKGSVFKCLLCQYKHIILTFTFPQQKKKKNSTFTILGKRRFFSRKKKKKGKRR